MSLSDDGDADPLTPDRVFDLLADGDRRRALAVLRASDGPMYLHELAAATAARAEDADPAAVTTDRRERTAVLLHHNHLPKLEDAGVVEYDSTVNRATLTDRAEELDPCFEVVEEFSEE